MNPLIRDFVSDIRFCSRMLVKSPLFSLTAILSLAIGVGANTSLFSVLRTTLLKSLSIPHANELRVIQWEFTGQRLPMRSLSGSIEELGSGGTKSESISYPAFQRISAHPGKLQQIAGFASNSYRVTVNSRGQTESVHATLVSGNFFDVLGVSPALGRSFVATDDVLGSSPVIILSSAYWVDRFGSSQDIIGQTLELNRMPMVIVGVLPPEFRGVSIGDTPELFLPLTSEPRLNTSGADNDLSDGTSWWITALARVRPPLSDVQALASIQGTFWAACNEALASGDHAELGHLRLLLAKANHGVGKYPQKFTRLLLILSVVALLLFLLACANLADLLLVRNSRRLREMSVRVALGASRRRILRQMMAESLTISCLGTVVGLPIGLITQGLLGSVLRVATPNGFDPTILFIGGAISAAAAFVFGSLPAIQAMRLDLQQGLREGQGATMSTSKLFLGKQLIAAQIIISTVLLVYAGLFSRTLSALAHSRLGFDADNVLLFDLALPNTQYKTPDGRARAFQDIQNLLKQLPGVDSVSYSQSALLAGSMSSTSFLPTGHNDLHPGEAWVNVVGTDFFKTMGIPLISGRDFGLQDSANTQKVAVVNQRLVRDFFPNESPIGRTFNDDKILVIGVCGDSKYDNVRVNPPPTYYLLSSQAQNSGPISFELKSSINPGGLTSSVRRLLGTFDSNLPLLNIRTQRQQLDNSLETERLITILSSVFGVAAIVLASIGIYGTIAYNVSRRTREIGIRMAIGATRAQVLAMIVGEGGLLCATGLLPGVLVALSAAWLVRHILYGISFFDSVTLLGSIGVMACVTLVASLAPACRAMRVEPVRVLRDE